MTPRVATVGLSTLLVLGVATLGIAALPAPPVGPLYAGAGGNSQSPRRGGTFVFHHESNVRSLDPHTAFNELSTIAIRLLFDGLLEYGEKGELVPSLAAEMPEIASDGLRYRFRLRPHVRFHDGTELTASAVKWSMERMLSPETPSQGPTYFSQLEGLPDYRRGAARSIAGIRVVDRYTLEFRLRAPDQTFLNAMAMTFAYPVARGSYATTADGSFRPIGTGPFELESWERGVQLTFRRNRAYWRPGRPYVDRMIYLENLNRNLAAMRFRNGDIDAVHRFSPADYVFFRRSRAWRPYVLQDVKVNLWGLAMNVEMPPFDNRHVRRAVAFAIDREGWNRARSGRLRITGQPIPPGLLGHQPNRNDAQRFDLKSARAEMARAGYPDGYPKEVSLWHSSGDTGRLYAELAQADLARIGIRARARPLSFAAYLEDTGKPKTAQLLMSGWSMDFPDPSNFLDSLFHSQSARPRNSTNRAFYRNRELDQLLDRARIETSVEARRALYEEASRIILHDAPWAFLWNDVSFEIVQPYVRNYAPNRVFPQDYRFVWLDLPRRRIASALSPLPSPRLSTWWP